MQKLIFISGSGRSGTHLIGRAISSHSQIEGRIEDPKTFGLITRLGTTQDLKHSLYNWALRALLYTRLNKILNETNLHILEKSHPSIWLFDKFASKFPNAFFIGVWRDVEPTVSSMLEHGGVLTWYDRLPLDRPNRFLGITELNKAEFRNYSIEEKCALRWLSHKNELFRLKQVYPDRFHLIKYEEFMESPEAHLSAIALKLDLPNEFEPEKFNMDSLHKWKETLSVEQVKMIHKVVHL